MAFPKFSEWVLQKEDCGEPEKPHGMKKISHTEKKSPGSRDTRSDLSKDYKGHIAHNGTVEPFEVKKGKSGKPVADVAN